MTARMRLTVVGMLVALGLACLVPADTAAAAGVGQICGGFVGFACGRGLWCNWPAGNCQGADLQGTCVEIPAVCAKNYKPVCGCDKRTYGNDCERLQGRVQKDHDGPCK